MSQTQHPHPVFAIQAALAAAEKCAFIHHFRGYSPFDGVDFVVGGETSWQELAVHLTHTREDEEAGLKMVSGPGFRSHSPIPGDPSASQASSPTGC